MMNIEELNEDCLLKIFTYLTINDLMTVKTVSPMFNYLVCETYKTYKSLSCDNRTVSVPEVLIMLERIGKHLNRFRYSGYFAFLSIENCQTLLMSIHGYCKNLTTLKLHSITFQKDFYQYLDLRKIKTLNLDCCNIRDRYFKTINGVSGTELTELSLIGNMSLNGSCLLHYRKLTYLNLQYSYIRNVMLIEILKNNPNIQSLNISNCRGLYFDILLEDIVRLLPNLTQFFMDCIIAPCYNPLASLKNLNILSINSYTLHHDEQLEKFLLLLKGNNMKLEMIMVNSQNLSKTGKKLLRQVVKNKNAIKRPQRQLLPIKQRILLPRLYYNVLPPLRPL